MALGKTYEPAEIEGKWYRHWEDSGAFAAGKNPKAKPYTIMIPLPNVTGSLHIGHALNNTIQDILIRYQRMQGRDCLWQVGLDHAGIATQMVVERKLEDEGIKRRDLGREKFVEKVWQWKEKSGGIITSQLKRLGASCDWGRERFTMDEAYQKAVRKKFVDLYNAKLIYKDKRLVNWDPKLLTAISDLEVEQREIDSFYWHLKYPLKDDPKKFIVVATTRPETMLGDTAVAVHPKDPRYQKLVGKMIAHPLTGRDIPIIADDWADPETGSGAVKITPAHDFNDFEVGNRHNLERINILGAHGAINENAPKAYQGLDRFEARKKVVADLENLGLLNKIEPKKIMAPFGDRSGVIIEPWLTDQWYVDAKTMAKPAIKAVETGKTKIVPKTWEKTYFEWMRNIQPWCISRQLWWGHRIPAWYDEEGNYFVAETEAEAQKQAGKGVKLTQDEDVLDTWFSSAMWPFATQGWPEKTPALDRYYPGSVLVTAFDILFFWVARMMMDGLYFMKEVPFDTVYIHGLVRDEKGQKMSKSKGNVVDPLEFMDKYGADALRFTLAVMETQGRDIKLSENRVQGYRNFATKLWNATRFAEMNGAVNSTDFDFTNLELNFNKAIVGLTRETAEKVTDALEAFKFNEATEALYHFVWHTFCDWYLEATKPTLISGKNRKEFKETQKTLAWCLDQIFILLHPFMPFITEELWNAFGVNRKTDLILAEWSGFKEWPKFQKEVYEFNWLVNTIENIRSARGEVRVPPGLTLSAKIKTCTQKARALFRNYYLPIRRMAKIVDFDYPTKEIQGRTLQVLVPGAELVIEIEGIIDIEAERNRLLKEVDKKNQEIKALEGRLKNKGFTANAPEQVVMEAKERLDSELAAKAKLEEALSRLS